MWCRVLGVLKEVHRISTDTEMYSLPKVEREKMMGGSV